MISSVYYGIKGLEEGIKTSNIAWRVRIKG
jgi:hypothetical protein